MNVNSLSTNFVLIPFYFELLQCFIRMYINNGMCFIFKEQTLEIYIIIIILINKTEGYRYDARIKLFLHLVVLKASYHSQ